MPNLLKSALYYAGKGWRVFPCKPHDKTPAVKWADEATTDAAKIKSWWGSNASYNIGIVCGRASNLVVLDVDAGHGGNESLMALLVDHGALPSTIESLTGGGGRHILFAHPGVEIRNSASKLGPGLDIRGDGGYIVAPPSIHPSGRPYEWEALSRPDKAMLAEMPEWLVYLLSERQPAQPQAPQSAAPVAERITQGGRNQALASLAGSMRRRGMDSDAIYAGLLAHNQTHCEPPLSEQEVKTIAGSMGRYQPKDPPRVRATEKQKIEPHEPLNAYQGAEAFIDLLEHLDGRDVKTMIPPIDDGIGGLERQTLTILAARPSMGKSTLAWQMARNVAASGKKVLFFSLEMSTASLYAKAACGAAGIRWRDVRNGTATETQKNGIITCITELMERYGENLLVDDTVNTVETITANVDKYRPDLIVVDHLRLVADDGDSEVLRLGQISKAFKDIAKAYNCAFLCLAQLNRGVESRDNKRPQLADLRESGHIEENADVVLMIYRDDYYDPPASANGSRPMSETEILVRKFRDDVKDTRIVLFFDATHQWFVKGEKLNA